MLSFSSRLQAQDIACKHSNAALACLDYVNTVAKKISVAANDLANERVFGSPLASFARSLVCVFGIIYFGSEILNARSLHYYELDCLHACKHACLAACLRLLACMRSFAHSFACKLAGWLTCWLAGLVVYNGNIILEISAICSWTNTKKHTHLHIHTYRWHGMAMAMDMDMDRDMDMVYLLKQRNETKRINKGTIR